MFVLAVDNATTTELPFNYEYWGFVVAIIGAAVGIFLIILVYGLDKKRRRDEEKYYKNKTLQNLREISGIFVDVIRESLGSGKGTPEEEEHITYALEEYFEQNYHKIQHLIIETDMAISKWVSLSTDMRTKYTDMVNSLSWLVTTYFPREKPLKTKMRIWTQHYVDLQKKKEEISEILASLPENSVG